jgi:hypothetical protein
MLIQLQDYKHAVALSREILRDNHYSICRIRGAALEHHFTGKLYEKASFPDSCQAAEQQAHAGEVESASLLVGRRS